MTDYLLLTEQLRGFCEEEPFYVPLFANASALLWETLPDINWAGFYFLRGGRLVLGPFQGKPACIRIEIGRGVCGAAVRENRVLRVADVHRFPGHIACDCASNAEIVLPIRLNGAVLAVLDIDSPTVDRFTQADEEGLTAFTATLEKYLTFT
ncbi:MAG: GAF domain-containing protein [Pseudoflavonifractor sp.]|nr:GAF domain-containing protein [Pseudoflavonifractor sp.]